MIKLLLLFLLPLSLYASKILSYNIYERTDRADVMITFDTPYHGSIKQSISKSKIIIKLYSASIESPKIKKVSSKFLQGLTITPMQNYTQIVARVPSSSRLIASKTSDAYGLRLRFTDKVSTKKKNIQASTTNSLSALPTKKDSELSSSYYMVVGILIIGILILFVLKKQIAAKTQQKIDEPWLFQSNQKQKEVAPTQNAAPTQNLDAVSIRFQKSIDSSNSVVMLDFGVESYLVLMGNSNILLDKFSDDKPVNQQEFDTILQSRHQELEDFLSNDESSYQTVSPQSHKEPLQAYKERAASLIYSDEA